MVAAFLLGIAFRYLPCTARPLLYIILTPFVPLYANIHIPYHISGITAFIIAQNSKYVLHRPSVKDGLASNHVHTAYCDAKGFAWFGTAGGLQRYDGALCSGRTVARVNTRCHPRYTSQIFQDVHATWHAMVLK